MGPEESFRVVPRVVRARPGDTIKFRLQLSGDEPGKAWVLFPEDAPFGTPRIEVDPADERTVPDVGVDVISDYEYAVYCVMGDRHEFAHASVPIIIIYPR
jgi:hypothetical protein